MSEQIQNLKSKSEVKLIIKNALILFVITMAAGLFLSIVNSMTEEPIAQQKIIKRDKALNAVWPDAKFEKIEITNSDNYENIQAVFEVTDSGDKPLGYAFMLTSKGYAGIITLVSGISLEGELTGIDIISMSETPGLGANAQNSSFKEQFQAKKAEELNVAKGNQEGQNIDALSGATITSKAVVDGVNASIEYFNKELKEGK